SWSSSVRQFSPAAPTEAILVLYDFQLLGRSEMPVNPTYPGVYIEEVPSGVRAIRNVATSVGAFIGPFRRGLQNEAVRIQSLSDFEREYGGLYPSSEASYAVQQFFLNGGTEAWLIRIGHPGSDAVGITAIAPAVGG